MNLCKCGCGQECKKLYVSGHNGRVMHPMKGKCLSEERCKQISENKKNNKYHLGFHHTKESKELMRLANLGRKHNEEWKINASKRNSGINNKMYGLKGKDNPLFGIPRSQETKEKLSKNMKENHFVYTDEMKRKMSEAKTRKSLSLEHIKNISESLKGSGNPMYGKPCPKGAGRCKWYWVNDVHCFGTYEKRFAEACFKWNISVKRVNKRNYFEDAQGKFSYLFDFIINNNQIVEIKGWKENPQWLRKLPFLEELNVIVLYEKDLINFENTGILPILEKVLKETL